MEDYNYVLIILAFRVINYFYYFSHRDDHGYSYGLGLIGSCQCETNREGSSYELI